MRIATWNVNSLKARLEKVLWWLERARPDVLLMQETKLADADAPHAAFREAGYELVHHGEGRWNGVAVAARGGVTDVTTNFGEPLRPGRTPDVGDDEPLAEARMLAATCGGVRVVSLYAPNGRSLDSPFYQAKLAWYERLAWWLERSNDPTQPLVLGGDFNVAPEDTDVWNPEAFVGGTHVSPPEREAFLRLCRWGLADAYRLHHAEPGRYTWWDYRAGSFHKNLGMRIDHLLVTRPVAERTVSAEIDREARKGKPVPSDHAPVVIDLDRPGHAFDAGWAGAEARRAARGGVSHRSIPFGAIPAVRQPLVEVAVPDSAGRIGSFGLNNAYGTWAFSSLDSLARGEAEHYALGRDLGSADVPLPGFQLGVYAGDLWQVGRRVSLTLGLRADRLALSRRAP